MSHAPTVKRVQVTPWCKAPTPGWINVLVSLNVDGKARDRDEAKATFAHEPWAADATYRGIARGFHIFQRPGPTIVVRRRRPVRARKQR